MDLARNLRTEKVSQLKLAPPFMVQLTCTIADAVKMMRQKKTGCLLICKGKTLVGVFNERDLLGRVCAAGRALTDPVEEVMTPEPEVVTARDTIGKVLARMEKSGLRHLPVVDDAGRPSGILSVKRLVHYLVEHFPSTVYNLPPDAGSFPQHRGGA